MRFLLSLLLACVLSQGLMAQGVAVRSNDGLATNLIAKGTFRIMSDGVNPGRLYFSGSTTNLASFQMVSNFLGISVDGGPASIITSAGDFTAGRNLIGSNVTAVRFIGSGSNLTDIGTSSLGFQPATNSFVGITNALGYKPGTNYTYNGEQFAFSGLQLSIKTGANITNATLFSSFGGHIDTLNHVLFDQQPEFSVDWHNRYLYDQSGVIAMWWKHRLLKDSAGASAIDWENKTFSDGWTFTGDGVGLTNLSAIPLLDGFGTNTILFSNSVSSVDAKIRRLRDTTGDVSVDWSVRKLYDSFEDISFDWESKTNSAGWTLRGTFIGNGAGLTNLSASSLVYSTNAHAGATNVLDMSKAYADFAAATHMSITGFSNVNLTNENSSVLMVTNGSGGNVTMSLTSGVTTMDGARTFVMTNNTLSVFSFSIYGNRWTNVAYRTFY